MNKLINLICYISAKYNTKNEDAYTLLEYCIGAAALGAIIFVATSALGNGINTYLTNLGNWIGGQNMPN